MKTLFRSIGLMVLCATVGLPAAEGAVAASSLPRLVYTIAETRADGQPGTIYFFVIHRGKESAMPVFLSKDAAIRFIATFPELEAQKMSPFSYRRTWLEDGLKKGDVVYLLEPKNASDGTAARVELAGAGEPKDSDELQRLFSEDQADRQPKGGAAIDWSAVAPRDRAREARIMELYLNSQLRTGTDFYNAAMILQHGQKPEDYLLCHELCLVAVSKGEKRALWLAAASEDRFLMAIGRTQRFGTQLTNPIRVDGCITDELRADLDVPTLEENEAESRLWHSQEQLNKPPLPTPAGVTPAAGAPVAPPSSAARR